MTRYGYPSDSNIYIAVLYAEKDKTFWEGLERHMAVLATRYQNVRIWSVNDIELGNDINNSIRTELQRADITLLLLSVDFINDQMVNDETMRLLERFSSHKEGERFIMPVLVNYIYGWKDFYDDHFDMEHLRVFDAVESSAGNKDKTYNKITASVAEFVEEINAKAIKIIIPTWVGFLGGIKYNNGFENSQETSLYRKYQRTIQFELNDNLDQACRKWVNGDANLIWATIDRVPYLLEKLQEYRPKVVFLVAWSNGTDQIIAKKDIKSIKDLKNKRIAFPLDSPARAFLLYVLHNHGLTEKDIIEVPRPHENLDLMGERFPDNHEVDAMVLWRPYLDPCLGREDLNVLAHTAQYPQVISDVLIASEEYIDLNREELITLLNGWYKENQAIVSEPVYQDEAIKVLLDSIVLPLPKIIPHPIQESLKDTLQGHFEKSLADIHLCGIEENLAYFGINTGQEGTGAYHYNTFMDIFYPEQKDEPKYQWEYILDTSIIEALST